MEKYCRHCRSKQHWTNECPELNPSHGAPRVITDTSILTRKVEDKPLPRRRPLVRPSSPPGPVPPQTQNETSPQPSRDELLMSRNALELECTRLRNRIAELESELKRVANAVAKPAAKGAANLEEVVANYATGRPRVANPKPSTLRARKARARKAAKARIRSGTDGADPAP